MKVPFDKARSSYVYVVVRGDLPLQHQAPQAIHAAMQASQAFPLSGEERLVLLQVPDLANLEHIKTLLDVHDISYKDFFEPDHGHGVTSLCTAPIPSTRLFNKLKLWHPSPYDT